MPKPPATDLRRMTAEFCAYAVLAGAYCVLVLHYFGGWLLILYQSDRRTYAGVALALIVFQGVALEQLTRVPLRLLGRKGRQDRTRSR